MLLRLGGSCLARCVQPLVGLEALSERLRAFKQQLKALPELPKAIEELALQVLQQWESGGLQLHVRLEWRDQYSV